MRLQDIAPVVSGMVVRDIEFQSLGFLESTLPRMLAYLEGERFLELLLCNPYIVGVITTPKLAEAIPQDRSLLLSPAPKEAFYQIHNYLATSTDFYGRSFPSEISSGAFIAPTAYIAPNDVRIGPGVVVEPHVTVMERTVIEAGVILRAGCVVGAQGFEFKQSDGRLRGVAHTGGVLLHSGAEIQSNATVCRSVFGGFTEIGEDSKISNNVGIAHNVRIGKRCLIAGRVQVGGSVTIGDDVWIGPGAVISTGITIGDRAKVSIGSVVTRNVLPDQRVTGNFAVEHSRFLDFWSSTRFHQIHKTGR